MLDDLEQTTINDAMEGFYGATACRRILTSAYMSMKAERDKYKAIVEADTGALQAAIDVDDMLSNDYRNHKKATMYAKEALALREKE